jgi:hypothetical protein
VSRQTAARLWEEVGEDSNTSEDSEIE